VVRLSFGAGLHFLFLDSIRGVLESRRPDGKMNSADTFLAGGLSRAGSAVIMCPITVIKTRMEYGGAGGIQYKVP
jgi:solute carrier family 25 protein 38